MSISRTAHWIWFGPNIPVWAEENISEFRRLHSSWTTRIWNELPANFPVELREIIDGLPWYSSRSDIFRYWLLAEYGGVFLDTDIVPLRSLEPLLQHSFFLAPCQPEGHIRPHLNCALMGSEAGSTVIRAILHECLRHSALGLPPKRIAYGPDLLTRLIDSKSHPEATVLPSHYFYPIPDRTTAHRFWQSDTVERDQILARFRPLFTDSNEPYAIHLWGVEGSSQRQVELAPVLES